MASKRMKTIKIFTNIFKHRRQKWKHVVLDAQGT
jgi:hypothetical protein